MTRKQREALHAAILAALVLASVVLASAALGDELAHCLRLAPKYGCPPEGIEYRLPDATRVDLLTDKYAIEVDYAEKWAESIGQARYYSRETGRKPGVILLIRDAGDFRYVERWFAASEGLGIRLWLEVIP